MSITSQHGIDTMVIEINEGKVCLKISLQKIHTLSQKNEKNIKIPSRICLSKINLNDGQWHSVFARR